MRGHPLGLGVCPHCGGLIKVSDQRVMGEFGGREADRPWPLQPGVFNVKDESMDNVYSEASNRPELDGLDPTQLPSFKRLGFKEWMDISGGSIGPVEDEGMFRLRAWRAGNDVRRSYGSRATMRKREVRKLYPEREACETDNMLWLVKNLGNDPFYRLIKAELFRELGDFRWAHKMLRTNLTDDCAGIHGYLSGLADCRNSDVHILPGGLRFPKDPRNLVPKPDEDDDEDEWST
ncbi:MAG: hypothetical protein IT466_06360 [Moraxellaceae bacterium]|nr:hypothetical protein [Moraxellaceae bacterium]